MVSHEDKEGAILDALEEVIPSISFFHPTVTCITLKTVGGNLTAAITEDEKISYVPVPSHISHISTVPVTELQKVVSLDADVDRVKWKDQSFAFKKTEENFEETLRELTILDRLRDSSYIIDLKALVVNQDNSMRGFLMPYMRAGNLEVIFFNIRKDLRIPESNDAPVFDWTLKITWAHQITQGFVDLHAIAAYNGDLSTQNVVLGPGGQAILIDFNSSGFHPACTAPEASENYNDPNATRFTVPAGVYSLGVFLYALS